MRLHISLLLLLLVLRVFSTPYANISHIDLKDGLSDLTVNAITQDSLGILYFGTENGLTIFDGNKFERYFTETNKNTISDNTIYSIMVDSKNRVWIGNWKGIDRYDRKSNKFKTYKVGESSYRIGAIFQDSKQRLWIGAFGLGLCYYDEDLDSIKVLKNSLLDYTSISSIYEDIRGNLWIGTETDGLFLYQPNQNKVYSFQSSIPGVCRSFSFGNNRVRALVGFNNGDIMIGTYDKGAFVYNHQTMQISPFYHTSNLLNTNSHISCILRDEGDNLWFGIDGGGVVKYDYRLDRVVEVAASSNQNSSLSTKMVRTIFFDANKTLWIGSYKNGIDYTFEAKLKRFYYYEPNCEFKSITTIGKIDDSKLFLGTDGCGLLTFNPSEIIFTKEKSSICENILTAFKADDNLLWIGTFTKGVAVVDKSLDSKRIFNLDNSSLEINDIRSIVGDKERIFLGTNGKGLKIYNIESDKFDTFGYNYSNPEKGIVYFGINTLMLDSRGILWIGTRDGMTIYEPNSRRFVNVKRLNGETESNSYNCFYEDLKGNVWAGTNRGLYKFTNFVYANSFNSIEVDFIQGLSYEKYIDSDVTIVSSIIEDNGANLWLGTNRGLVQFNIQTSKSRYYFQEEGVALSVFNSNSVFKDGDYLYFGGNSGLLSFKPEEVFEELPVPNVILTSLLINMKEFQVNDQFKGDIVLSSHINYAKEIVLNSGARIVSIQFGSTNSFLASEIEYAYRLQGLNDEWTTVSGDNLNAAFSNLSAGDYQFEVKARYRHSDWNKTTCFIKIKILPPFWETFWFKALLIIIIVATLYFSYQRRIKLIKNRNQMLEQLVQEKSSELLKEKDEKLVELEKRRLLISEKERVERERLVLENEIHWAQSEKFRLELELKTQLENSINGELSATLVQVTKKNDLLKWLKNELNHLLNDNGKSVSENIKAIIRKIDSEFLFHEDWQKFETHFNVVYADFIQKMKTTYPDLTSKELRLCSYIKMNLSSSEIAQLSNITMRGVEKSRSRLRKKMNLDGSVDIYEYIIGIDNASSNINNPKEVL